MSWTKGQFIVVCNGAMGKTESQFITLCAVVGMESQLHKGCEMV
jgi:hypothetical protein